MLQKYQPQFTEGNNLTTIHKNLGSDHINTLMDNIRDNWLKRPTMPFTVKYFM